MKQSYKNFLLVIIPTVDRVVGSKGDDFNYQYNYLIDKIKKITDYQFELIYHVFNVCKKKDDFKLFNQIVRDDNLDKSFKILSLFMLSIKKCEYEKVNVPYFKQFDGTYPIDADLAIKHIIKKIPFDSIHIHSDKNMFNEDSLFRQFTSLTKSISFNGILNNLPSPTREEKEDEFHFEARVIDKVIELYLMENKLSDGDIKYIINFSNQLPNHWMPVSHTLYEKKHLEDNILTDKLKNKDNKKIFKI